jgi:hypothetical protein
VVHFIGFLETVLIFSFSIVIGVFNNYSNLPTGRVFVPLPGGTTSFSRREGKQNGSKKSTPPRPVC